MSTKKMSVFVEPHSLFRYITELDPVKHEEGRGNTKGGYLGGRIELPSFKDEIRVVISTHQDTENCMHDNESNRCHHPNLLQVIRLKGDKKRCSNLEPKPNEKH